MPDDDGAPSEISNACERFCAEWACMVDQGSCALSVPACSFVTPASVVELIEWSRCAQAATSLAWLLEVQHVDLSDNTLSSEDPAHSIAQQLAEWLESDGCRWKYINLAGCGFARAEMDLVRRACSRRFITLRDLPDHFGQSVRRKAAAAVAVVDGA
jgi:hypothetical protein